MTANQSAKQTPASTFDKLQNSSCEIPEFDDACKKSIIVSTVSRFDIQETAKTSIVNEPKLECGVSKILAVS